jgi:hypothetical protein
MRSGEICGFMAEDVIHKGNLGRFIKIQPNAIRQLKSKAAEREVPLHQILEQLLDTSLPKQGGYFPISPLMLWLSAMPSLEGSTLTSKAAYSTPPASGSSPSASAQAPLSTSRHPSWGITLHVQPTS